MRKWRVRGLAAALGTTSIALSCRRQFLMPMASFTFVRGVMAICVWWRNPAVGPGDGSFPGIRTDLQGPEGSAGPRGEARPPGMAGPHDHPGPLLRVPRAFLDHRRFGAVGTSRYEWL
jgi:hypothetical protein